MPFKHDVLNEFKSSLNDQKPWSGINAKEWGEYFLDDLNSNLDKKFLRPDLLNQEYLKEFSNEELCIAILSWGGMNREHGKSLFSDYEWLDIVEEMRSSDITRIEAYKRFKKLKTRKKLKGMGPAYFTKLICFVNLSLNGYIMDQWTSKSVNLLMGEDIVHLTKQGIVTDRNTANTYDRFCRIIEDLALEIGESPINTEEFLFSYGGHHKGVWRKFVVGQWYESKGSLKSKPEKEYYNDQEFDVTDMEPIKFEKALDYFSNEWIEMATLGNRSTIKVNRDDHSLIIKNSRRNEYTVDQQHWNQVMNRIDELPQEERIKTSRYGQGNNPYNWNDCPNRVSSIYVPAIVRYIIKIEGL